MFFFYLLKSSNDLENEYHQKSLIQLYTTTKICFRDSLKSMKQDNSKTSVHV